jgi:hypothetical protein
MIGHAHDDDIGLCRQQAFQALRQRYAGKSTTYDDNPDGAWRLRVVALDHGDHAGPVTLFWIVSNSCAVLECAWGKHPIAV